MSADRDQARRLRATGLSYARIARRLGVSLSTVYRWCNPAYEEAQRAASRAWKAAHREHVRAYDVAYHERTREPCVRCGASRGKGNASAPNCPGCAWLKRRRIRGMYLDGWPVPLIAVALNTTTGTITMELVRMRRHGVELPHRHPGRRRELEAAA